MNIQRTPRALESRKMPTIVEMDDQMVENILSKVRDIAAYTPDELNIASRYVRDKIAEALDLEAEFHGDCTHCQRPIKRHPVFPCPYNDMEEKDDYVARKLGEIEREYRYYKCLTGSKGYIVKQNRELTEKVEHLDKENKTLKTQVVGENLRLRNQVKLLEENILQRGEDTRRVRIETEMRAEPETVARECQTEEEHSQRQLSPKRKPTEADSGNEHHEHNKGARAKSQPPQESEARASTSRVVYAEVHATQTHRRGEQKETSERDSWSPNYSPLTDSFDSSTEEEEETMQEEDVTLSSGYEEPADEIEEVDITEDEEVRNVIEPLFIEQPHWEEILVEDNPDENAEIDILADEMGRLRTPSNGRHKAKKSKGKRKSRSRERKETRHRCHTPSSMATISSHSSSGRRRRSKGRELCL